MRVGLHHLPGGTFSLLAAGGGDAAAIEHLHAGQHSKRMVALQGVVRLARQTAHKDADRVRHAYTLLADVHRDDPAAGEAVMRYPTVASWAMRAMDTLAGSMPPGGPAEPAELAGVAAAAAIGSGRRATIEVPIGPEGVTLPSLGRARTPGESGFAIVRSGAGEAEIVAGRHRVTVPADPGADGPGWQGLRRLSAEHRGSRLDLVVDDQDPHRMPDAARTERRLTAAELDAWAAHLQPAWTVLVRRHPVVAAEVRAVVQVLTPMVAPERGTSSGTSKLAFGNIGMSAQPDPHSFAVTLAHEVQHAKLSAITDIVRLTEEDDGSRYYAPWREDPRPLDGLLHGAYAHMAIAAFWMNERTVGHPAELTLRAHVEFAHWRDATAAAIQVLRRSGRLTPAGELFSATMERTVAAMKAETVPDLARRRAGLAAERHLSRWRLDHGDGAAASPASSAMNGLTTDARPT
ncbi:HEXXH motif domain-containing protein [Actinomadura sp. B10D3]|uniref:HEXXH motif domain-containing protein n=1 Tax=Actinomadura sp. B10D3 TaxID=3153557 RepID=UPI00325F6BAB